ncbi:Hypothetical protein ABZS17H1_00668 [Kosakonia cowanii]
MHYVNTNENYYQFDDFLLLWRSVFCDLRPGETEWVII